MLSKTLILVLIAAVSVAYAVNEEVKGSVNPSAVPAERAFTTLSFTTFTWLKTTVTTTSTFTSVTTCTTSTSALKTCTKSGGRKRRGLGASRHRRGLFFDDDEAANDGSIFLPSEKRSSDPVDEVVPDTNSFSETVVPLELQSGFKIPEGVDASRFLLSLGTSTLTVVTISTSTTSLTAICQSTTGWSLCGASGK